MSEITRECIAFDIMKNKMLSRGTYEEMVEYCKNLNHVYVYSSVVHPPQLSEDVEEYIEIIQDSCVECKYSCWHKENYDLDACELNKDMKEMDLNTSMIGDGCPLPNKIKQHIQAQASEIKDKDKQIERIYELSKRVEENYLTKLNRIRKVVYDKNLSPLEIKMQIKHLVGYVVDENKKMILSNKEE